MGVVVLLTGSSTADAQGGAKHTSDYFTSTNCVREFRAAAAAATPDAPIVLVRERSERSRGTSVSQNCGSMASIMVPSRR